MEFSLNIIDVFQILNSDTSDPHSILGMHNITFNDKNYLAIRCFLPDAKSVDVIDIESNIITKMQEISHEGFFEALILDCEKFKYALSIEYKNGNTWRTADPYSFPPVISDYDRYLFNSGTHYEMYEKLGAHAITIDDIPGVLFAVWAPNAKRVSVVSDFNFWNGKTHMMRKIGDSGIFELFIPGMSPGVKYKFEIKTQNNDILLKTDPYAIFNELRPNTASIIYKSDFSWNDSEWLDKRVKTEPIDMPASIYEVHLGSWKKDEYGNFLSYREIAHQLVFYLKEMNYTHVELMPIMEHPFDDSWGYQVTGYFAPTSRFGEPDDFKYFVDYCHQNGIGVILDWVPAHFPKDEFSLAKFDGTCLYEHLDPRQGEHPDWGTLIFNISRNEVKNFLISNALYWIEKYHVDGLRVDAVASMLYLDYGKRDGEWIPNQFGGHENLETVEFLKHMNSIITNRNRGVMIIAEESTAWHNVSKPAEQGGLGFNLKWNMGFMNDILRFMSRDPIYRKYHMGELTFSLVYAFSENFVLVFSHDEVVHGKCSMINKMPGNYWQKFANLRLLYGFMGGHPGKKLLFMGNDIAQFNEWNSASSIEWSLLEYPMHRGLQKFVSDLNALYLSEEILWESEYHCFNWINCSDSDNSIVSFERRSDKHNGILVFVCNFTPVVHSEYRVGVSCRGSYRELLNSDSSIYGGSNVGNCGEVLSDDISWDNKPYSLSLKIPPLGVLVLKYL